MLEFNATFLVSIISFIVFIIIMNAIFYKPILSIIDERNKYITDKYNDAKNSKDKAQMLLEEKDKRLNETLIESKKLVSEKVSKANAEAKSITDAAKIHSATKIQSAKDKLKDEEMNTEEALKSSVKNLAETISSKILGESTIIENVDYELISKELK